MGDVPPSWRAPLVWRVLMVAARVLCALVGRLRVTGDVPAQLRGAALLVASNHIGNLDPIALVAAMHKRGMAPRLLAAAGLFRAPIVGRVLYACGHIPVNRRSATAADALHEAEAALAAGAVVAMYPEGRIGLDPELWPERGKTGLARLALRTGTTVLPAAQWGAHEVVVYGGAWEMARSALSSLWRRPVIRVHFGPPVDLSDLPADATGVAMQATERIMQAVADALVPLRADEPRLPRFVDVTRPVSTARVRRRMRHGRPAADAALGSATATRRTSTSGPRDAQAMSVGS
jgi:1-acyl-sn-glycerol-3-phosphate acyltransferase